MMMIIIPHSLAHLTLVDVDLPPLLAHLRLTIITKSFYILTMKI